MNVEDFEEVKKWLSNVKESSKHPYLTGLRIYVKYTGLNPTQIIDEAEEDRKNPGESRVNPSIVCLSFTNTC